MKPTDLAERYFASVRVRDIESFIALFAEEATFTTPDGRVFAPIPTPVAPSLANT
jgi:ketosteroid isomerase-like protein